MISDHPEVAERKQVVSCPSCGRTLTTPAGYSGKIGCPDCGHAFVVEALIDEAEHIEDEDFQVIDPATGFLYGLFGPASIPVIVFALAMTGIFESSSPGLMGLTLFMYSLCLWPIIGFVIAASSNTFVESFRKGAKISGIVSIFVMVGMWILFLSWASSGVTN